MNFVLTTEKAEYMLQEFENACDPATYKAADPVIASWPGEPAFTESVRDSCTSISKWIRESLDCRNARDKMIFMRAQLLEADLLGNELAEAARDIGLMDEPDRDEYYKLMGKAHAWRILKVVMAPNISS